MDNLSKAKYADEALLSCYDLSSGGMGVQRQLVKDFANNPEIVANTDYLLYALHSGANSNLLTSAFFDNMYDKQKAEELGKKLHQLTGAANNLMYRVLRTLGNETTYDNTSQAPLTLEEVAPLFEKLIKKGYFSNVPNEESAKTLLEYGLGLDFSSDYAQAGHEMDAKKLRKDELQIMFGDGKKLYTGFHADKLEVMADFGDAALGVWRMETKKPDYIINGEALLVENWKKLFNEDVPPASALILSSRETVESARKSIS